MKNRSIFYVMLISCLCAGLVVSPSAQVPADTIQFHQIAGKDGLSQQTETNENLTSDAYIIRANSSGNSSEWIENTSEEFEMAASPWWSIWYYVVLTLVVCSILIYGYIEYGRNVVSVRQEIDEIREENENLNKELGKRMKEIDSTILQLKKAEDELIKKTEKAGMAEIAAGVLHNVANVLSSVNSSNCYIRDTAKNSKVEGLIRANDMLREHIDHIDQFIFQNPKGKKLLNYYLKLEEPLRRERDSIVSQSERLEKKINIINDVITAQQVHAGAPQETTETSLTEVVEATLSLQDDLVDQYKLSITNNLNAETPVIAQRSKLIHVLVNFIKNAGESMEENHPENRNLSIKSWEDPYKVYLSVSDNGSGIKAENLEKIFFHTYTTKNKSHGFGLHSSATYMKEMGGQIEVNSDGIGKGTTFTLVFPIIRQKEISRQN